MLPFLLHRAVSKRRRNVVSARSAVFPPVEPVAAAAQTGAARGLAAGLGLLALTVAVACGPSGPVLSPDPSGLALYEQGEQALADEDWRDAVEAFDTLLKNYPSSPYLAEARLGHGKAQYELGRPDSLILAIDAFQNFLTYHPSHPRTDYAQYMIGRAYMVQMRSPDRDQANTEQAVEAFRRFVDNYPDSALLPEVRAQLRRALDRLAESELRIARWQLENGHLQAAGDRARDTLDRFPDSGYRCDLLWVLAESIYRGEPAPGDEAPSGTTAGGAPPSDRPAAVVPGLDRQGVAVYYREIVDDYPGCEYASRAAERLRNLGPPAGR